MTRTITHVQDGTAPTGVGVRRELGRRPSTDVDALHAVGRDVLEAVEVR